MTIAMSIGYENHHRKAQLSDDIVLGCVIDAVHTSHQRDNDPKKD